MLVSVWDGSVVVGWLVKVPEIEMLVSVWDGSVVGWLVG